MSGTSKRTLGECIEGVGAVKRQKMSKEHPAAGLKLAFHGNVYQLKLLTLFLKRGLDLGYSFALATEMIDAEKLDDIVFGYTDDDGKDVCRFLQAKHKQDETKKITLRDLLTEKDGEFSIQKYFISYCKIKRNPEFNGYDLRDFTLCTNINLDETLANNLEEITDLDNILHFEYYKGFKRYRIDLDRFSEKDRLLSILRRTSELVRLANMLAFHVFDGKRLELRDLFKDYHGVLSEKVIERVEIDGVKVGKFRSEFINGESEQSSVFESFRKSFYERYQHVSKKTMNENEFWVKMKETNLKISSNFGREFVLDPDPQLTKPEELVEKIAKAIKVADRNIVKILREPGKEGVIKNNIEQLAGYVFVKKEDQSKEFYFNSQFLNNANEKLPNHLKQFRAKFIDKLEDEGIEFSKMNEYKFQIANFVTCEEGQLYMKPSLPDDYIDYETDIKEFFGKFFLSVNQPNEEKLGEIIQYEIGKDFNLIDSDLMASKLQEYMLNWMKDKKGRFLTNEEGKRFFTKIRQKVSKLVLIGPTLVYLAKIQQFQMSFRDDLKELREFLDSEDEQIFNLISSCEDTVFSSIRVLQTLKNSENYQTDDSYIYMSLNSLLYIRKRVMEAFSSGTSNLLAIECKAKKTEVNSYKLYRQLSDLLKIEKYKKVILITLKNDIFSEKFKTDFSANNHYKEINDEKINLTDLTDKSREKILMEGKVVFLGKEVSLGAMVDAESTHLLSGEVLSMLINNDKLEIGKPPIDPTHIEVEDYFINRTLIRHIMIKSDFVKDDNFFVLDDKNPDGPVELCDDVKKEIDGSYTDIIIISDTCDQFIKLCEEYREQHSIHWLIKVNDRYIWQQSCGDLTKLRRFIDRSAQSVTKYTPNKITDVSDKVVLIAAEPGMGKSVLLSHLSLKTRSIPSPLWIVRTNLVDHSTEFSDWLSHIKINTLEAAKFLYKMIGFELNIFKDCGGDRRTEDMIYLTLNGQNIEIDVGSNITKNMTGSSLLEINLFAHFFNKGKVILLFDGFDEISPDYNKLVVNLLKVLKDTKVKSLWLTTRPYNIQREPENQFSTFAYSLQPFLEEDQNNFLKKFWTKNMELEEFDEEKADVFIDELLHQFSESTNDQDRKFLSIPLQIYMIAVVFYDEFEKFHVSKSRELSLENRDALSNKLDLVTLYENFLETKFDIELEKTFSNFSGDQRKPGAIIIKRKTRSNFRKDHEILALHSIFQVDQVKKVLSEKEQDKITKLKKLISKAKTKTGVISKIIDGKPEFIHRTFAEYLAAQFIWKKFNSIQPKSFQNKVVQDIVIKMLIKDDAIQVSKFLQLIAKGHFLSGIAFSTWESKIETLLTKLTGKIKDYGAKKKDNNYQSTKLLLGIVEFFFLGQDEENQLQISEDQSPKLLRVCAEMGYTKLASALTSLNTELLKQLLSQEKWFHSPLWIAAENGHLDIIKFLMERFSYDVRWEDEDGQFLIQRVFQKSAFNVLKSCLELNIIDCEPYEDSEGVEYLPIHEALAKQAPVEVIKLLMEKTDADRVNKFIHNEAELPVSDIIISELLDYDKPMEIIELAMRKGIDLSFCLNAVLDKFDFESVCDPVSLIKNIPTHRIDFIDRLSPCSGCNNLWNLFPIIEHLLKAGVGYSYVDGRRDPPKASTYSIVKQMHDMHKILNEVYNLHKQNDEINNDPRRILLKLIFNYIRSLGFEDVTITINPNELCILPRYTNKSNGKLIRKLICNVIRSSLYTKSYKCAIKSNKIICISPDARHRKDFNDPHDPFPKFKHVMTELLFNYYIHGNGNWELVKSAVDEIKKSNILAKSSTLPIRDFSYFSDYVHEIYRSEVIENFEEENRLCESLDNFEENKRREVTCIRLAKNLFCDVLLMYFHQYYKMDDALEEISKKVSRLEKVINELLEMKRNSSCEDGAIILDNDRILKFLDLENIACESEDLQNLVSEIYEYSDETGVNDLTGIWFTLNHIGQQKVTPVLEQMLKFSDQSKQIFELFEQLHEGYNNLVRAIVRNDINEVSSTLQNVKPDFVKAIIHGQDEDYGSPLHYAALNGQVEIMNIFLDHGANPNLRLCNNFEKITHFAQAVEKIEKGPFLSDDFINWTPLYFAILNNHKQAVQNLIERGVDVNYVLNPDEDGHSPLHISALLCGSLEIARLLLKNGARYNVRNEADETPLNLATIGSDVGNLLCFIDVLFRIVEEGETNAVHSVFEVLDFDSWEAVLSAKNTDDETLLKLTESNGQEDIFELLEEKLRLVESRRL